MGFNKLDTMDYCYICQFDNYNWYTDNFRLFILFDSDMKERCVKWELPLEEMVISRAKYLRGTFNFSRPGSIVIVHKIKNKPGYTLVTMQQMLTHIAFAFKSGIIATVPALYLYNISFVRDVEVGEDSIILQYKGSEDDFGINIPLLKESKDCPEYVLTLGSVRRLYDECNIDADSVCYLLKVGGVPVKFLSVKKDNNLDKALIAYQDAYEEQKGGQVD